MQQTVQQPAPESRTATPLESSNDAASLAAPFAHDDYLIGPPSPGLALVRLLQVEARLPEAWGDLRAEAQAAREGLSAAVAHSCGVQRALDGAHALLLRAWERVTADEQAEALCVAMGFPPHGMKASAVGAVDVSTVTVTHARPARQVMTTINFRDAANAMGYRLFETKVLPNGEDYEDSSVSSYLPLFTRVRLAPGEHRLRIQSRNAHTHTLCEYFTITVPKP